MSRCQEAREDEAHILFGECPAYNDLLDQPEDLKEDEGLVKKFKKVLERRDLIDEVEQEEIREEEERQHALAVGLRTPPMHAS
jgi:hypothetical protein